MGVIEEINKLHISVQTVGAAFLFIMPIWYIDIFLFANHFFNTNPIYIPIVFSFVLSTCWIIASFLASATTYILSNPGDNLNKETEVKEDALMLSSGILIGIIVLALDTIIYYFDHNYGFFPINITKYGMFGFIMFSFLFIMSINFTALLFGYLANKNKNEKEIKDKKPYPTKNTKI